jgi:hypothetical protein
MGIPRLSVFLAIFSASLISCVTPPVTGPASAAISASDVREIKELVAQRRDIKQGVLSISAERADRALVRSGSQSSNGADYSDFTVIKVHGHWHISSPIKQQRVYPTG